MKLIAVIDEKTFNLRGSVGSPFTSVTSYTIPQIITTALNLLLIASALGGFFYLLLGAVQWITAGGDKESVEKARKKITQALVGLIIVFSIYATGSLVNTVFNVDIFHLCIPSLVGGSCAPSSRGGSGSQVNCSPTCKSNKDGSTAYCYPQDIGGGIIQQVSCGPGGFICNPSPCWTP